MKAITLTKPGPADKAFEMLECPVPVAGENEVLIRVTYSGLNFADVMARKGMYKDAPPLPSIIGYDVSGHVEAIGKNVKDFSPGDAVFAMTRFGGYAEFVVCNELSVAKVPHNLDMAAATALATQYNTAYYCGAELVNLHEGDGVLIHSAAGGVGSALVQWALHKKCTIYATAGSDDKIKMLMAAGVSVAINYSKVKFADTIMQKTNGKGVDVIFDAVGGSSVRQGIACLSAGGRMVCYGASSMTASKNNIQELMIGISFGFYNPGLLTMAAKSILGVNMLRIADEKPKVIKRCLDGVCGMVEAGVFRPNPVKIFPVSDIAAAHAWLEGRQSTGKVALEWGLRH